MNHDKSLMGNGNRLGAAHKDSERWEYDPRRRDNEYRNPSSRRPRRSRSRSRSPRRIRRSKSRSRSPRPLFDRHDRSPRRRYDRDMDDSSHKWSHSNGRSGGYGSRGRAQDDPSRRAINREMAAIEASKRSIKENRVYVGNLAFSVKWSDLKNAMNRITVGWMSHVGIGAKLDELRMYHQTFGKIGDVVFAEVMVLPNGMSKGCGVVEFATRADAERAVKELNDTPLLGRQVFVREDREEEARFGPLAVSGGGARGPMPSGFGGRGRDEGGYSGGHGSFSGGSQPCKQLAISGLPNNVGWQDLKDMFRSAGSIVRADVFFSPDGSPTGNGMVIFETARDAQNAISMFNGFEYEGRTMEVREDRGSSANGGSRGSVRGSSRGGRGAPRGGFASGGAGGRDTSNLYGDYSGQDNPSEFRGGPRGAAGGPSLNIQPNQQIFVKNLPWSTSNDDLVELFQTTGKVQNAEVLFDGGISKGVGVVEFETVDEAETAIAKFQNYSYGGRPLSLEFNGRWRDFSASASGR